MFTYRLAFNYGFNRYPDNHPVGKTRIPRYGCGAGGAGGVGNLGGELITLPSGALP